MIVSTLGWVLIVAVLILLVAIGGLITSALNHHTLEELRAQAAALAAQVVELRAQVAHTNNNVKAARAAAEHFGERREEGAR